MGARRGAGGFSLAAGMLVVNVVFWQKFKIKLDICGSFVLFRVKTHLSLTVFSLRFIFGFADMSGWPGINDRKFGTEKSFLGYV